LSQHILDPILNVPIVWLLRGYHDLTVTDTASNIKVIWEDQYKEVANAQGDYVMTIARILTKAAVCQPDAVGGWSWSDYFLRDGVWYYIASFRRANDVGEQDVYTECLIAPLGYSPLT
jgi:hypothetical protein